jgi:hypothetical protein
MAADAPVERQLVARKGFSLNERVLVTDRDTGLARNLTGYTPRLVINPSSGAQVIITTGTGLVLTPSAGQIDIKIDDAVTAGWTWDSGNYTLGIDNGNPEGHELLMYGSVLARTVPV